MSNTPQGSVLLDVGLHPEDHLREIEWAKRISECLDKAYPGYGWAVNVNLRGKMVTVQAMRLSGEWGFYLKLDKVMHDPRLECVKKAGGEILERYRVRRGQVDIDQIANLGRDFRKNFLVDAA